MKGSVGFDTVIGMSVGFMINGAKSKRKWRARLRSR